MPVHLWDERLTTQAAERMLIEAGVRRRTRRGLVDQVAATMILQGFLDRQQAAARREGR
jgi:putative Holliday junction resolvase